MWNGKYLIAVIIVTLLVAGARTVAQRAQAPPSRRQAFSPVIPKTWDDAAMATLEVPLANPIGSPKHVSADYYYRIPVRPIYKQYTHYAPSHEPPGYMDWLKQQEPEIVWGVDPKTGVQHAPPLKTEADWIKAGEIVFDAPIIFIAPLPPQIASEIFPASGGRSPLAAWIPLPRTSSARKERWSLGLAVAMTAT